MVSNIFSAGLKRQTALAYAPAGWQVIPFAFRPFRWLLLVLVFSLMGIIDSAEADGSGCEPTDFVCDLFPIGSPWSGQGLSFKPGWITLTDERKGRVGYAYYDKAFSPKDGLKIEFDFAAGFTQNKGGDGLSFFLFDGGISKSKFKVGAKGGALGYGPGSQGGTGLAGAYFGVGFDEYGNFSTASGGRAGARSGKLENAIVVRGSEGENYKLLGAKRVDISIATKVSQPGVGQPRRAVITLASDMATNKYKVTVELTDLQTSRTATFSQVLDKAPFTTLKFGFAASTGASTATHGIRNIRVTRAPVRTRIISGQLSLVKKDYITQGGFPSSGGTPIANQRVFLHLNSQPQGSQNLSVVTDNNGEFRISAPANEDVVIGTDSIIRGNAIADQVWSSAGGFCKQSEQPASKRDESGWCFGGASDAQSKQYPYQISIPKGSALPENGLKMVFSYDVVTNTNKAGVGSLSQFVKNANADQGSGKMLFVPVIPENDVQRGWRVELAESLKLRKEGIELDGTALSYQRPWGDALVSRTIQGYTKDYKVGKDDRGTIKKFEQSDLTLFGNRSPIVHLQGDHQKVKSLTFLSSNGVTGIQVEGGLNDVSLNDNLFGVGNRGTQITGQSIGKGVETGAKSEVNLTHNMIRFNSDSAVDFQGNGQIVDNVMTDGSSLTTILLNSADVQYERNVRIESNQISNSSDKPDSIVIDGKGLLNPSDFYINYNTVSGGEAGLRMMALTPHGTRIAANNNLFDANKRTGVVVSVPSVGKGSNGNTVYTNIFTNQGGLPVDLIAEGGPDSLGDGLNPLVGNSGNPAWANRGMDHPVITGVSKSGSNLNVSGYANTYSVIEIYRKQGNNYYYLFTKNGDVRGNAKLQYTDPQSGKTVELSSFNINGRIRRGTTLSDQDEVVAMIYERGRSSEFSMPMPLSGSGSLSITIWKDENRNSQRETGEQTLPGVAVQLFDLRSGSPVLVSKLISSAEGSISLPGLASGKYQISVVKNQTVLEGLTAGAQTPETQEIEISKNKNTAVRFGYIRRAVQFDLSPDHRRTVQPGTFVSFIHKLTSSQAGKVNVSATWPEGEGVGWPVTLTTVACDENDNAPILPIVDGAVKIKADQPVCLQARFFVPADTEYGHRARLTVKAEMETEQSKRVTETVTDDITVSKDASGQLVLSKTVQNLRTGEAASVSNQAASGDVLHYVISYTNTGTRPVTDVIITDQTAPFTVLSQPVTCGSNTCTDSFEPRNKGYRGQLIWPLKEPLQPGDSRSVSYDVIIE